MEILNKVIEALSSVEGSVAVIAIVVDFALRLIPSQKPLSVLHLAAGVIKLVGEICLRAGALLDKVLPQKLVENKE